MTDPARPGYFHTDTMKDMMRRSRDILRVAKQLYREEGREIPLTDCIKVVTSALDDVNADRQSADMENLIEAIDWIRRGWK